MSEHCAKVVWEHAGGPFDYDSYSRNHRWIFPNGREVAASSAPEFLGDGGNVDPEEAFVASVSSCHMLTFLAIAAKKRMRVESYSDDAVGTLEKNEDGKLAITRVVLRPMIVFGGDAEVGEEQLAKLHAIAHRECFIANSITADVQIV